MCVICAEPFGSPKVVCPYCSFEACRACCTTFLAERTVATCMNCPKEWTRKFMRTALTKKFLDTTWKLNRQKVLYDRELALLPATQLVVEESIRAEKEMKQAHLALPQTPKLFIRACPSCPGFLSTDWNCGLCDQSTCSDCHAMKADGHVCHADELATAKLLNSDTKTCPKCATGIFKIEGCDQMWCTQCHTAFSWKTGQIETRIHNPHFYEWQRRNASKNAPKEANFCGVLSQNLCGAISFAVRNRTDLAHELLLVDNIIQSTLHLQIVELPHYQRLENNESLRISYLRKRITQDEFKTRIQRSNKLHDKNRETADVLELFIATVTDILLRLHEELSDAARETFDRHLGEIDAIRVYANECLLDIATTYSQVVKRIHFKVGDERNYVFETVKKFI